MENETYIKLYRKLLNHNVFSDETAFRVFIWILLSVDYETGTMTSGRFWASSILGLNPNTFYKVLKRLEKKYDLITLNSNNKNTQISVNNWNTYQQSGNSKSNNKVTTKEQQSNNKVTLIKNIRNKEIKNIYVELIGLFNEFFERNFTLTDKRKKLISERLKIFSEQQLKDAVQNLSKNKFYRGKNDRNWSADPDFLFRNDENVDKALNLQFEVKDSSEKKELIDRVEKFKKQFGVTNER